ncbi:MAG TPA: kelch repeat-containing protein [Candidatus Polarisedimenticolaceae bacterium]|nr:kelch repeat-containing protein [Candidatus Polarisedimenticolaceae bacterium]
MFLLLALVLTVPAPSAGHSLVYAATQGGVLLVHGESAGPARLWRWSGSSWEDRGELGTTPRSLAACAYDAEHHLLVVHGGALPNKQANGSTDWKVDGQTLAWDGKTWRVLAEGGPTRRDHHAMVYDSARKKLVLYGGGDADPTGRADYFGDTWEWDGKVWTQVATAGPGPRVHHAMAYDALRGRTVMTGGYGPKGPDGKTWEWDGKAWEDKGSSDVAFRTSPRLAFDGSRKKVVLFGGENRSGMPADTYEWDGTRWTRIAEQGPPGRTVHALAYDEARKALVLFGGAGPDPLADTWEFREGVWKRADSR